MKTILCILLLNATIAFASPDPEMELINGNIHLTFNDYESAVGFENYKCNIDFGNWVYSLAASKVTGQSKYKCLDQGSLSANVKYNVSFAFEDRPWRNTSLSEVFVLSAYQYVPIAGVNEFEYSIDDYLTLTANGFVFDDVDLRGVIKYPVDIYGDLIPGTHPVFIMQHGQHAFCNVLNGDEKHTTASCPDRIENHKGYDTLLSNLANEGYIAVSIDAYDLLSFKHPNDPAVLGDGYGDQRASLFEEHMIYLQSLNQSGFFQGSMDFTELSLGGHSRGGAAAYNTAKNNPVLGVKSVSMIAPSGTLTGYTGTDSSVYVVLGSADNDVVDFWGFQAYSNSDVKVDKGLSYIRGANHNWFNSKWTDDDSTILRTDMLSHVDQEKLGADLISNYILNNSDLVSSFNVDYSSSKKDSIVLSNGIDQVPATIVGRELITGSFWTKDFSYSRIKKLTTVGSGHIIYDTSGLDASNKEFLSFRVAQADDISDFKLLITVNIGGILYDEHTDIIPKAYDLVPVWGLPKLNFMNTVKINLKEINSNLSDVRSIKITIPYATTIYLDDVEIY